MNITEGSIDLDLAEFPPLGRTPIMGKNLDAKKLSTSCSEALPNRLEDEAGAKGGAFKELPDVGCNLYGLTRSVPLAVIRKLCSQLWGKKGLTHVSFVGPKRLLLKFDHDGYFDSILDKGDWHLAGCLVLQRRWPTVREMIKSIAIKEENQAELEVSIHYENLPLKCSICRVFGHATRNSVNNKEGLGSRSTSRSRSRSRGRKKCSNMDLSSIEQGHENADRRLVLMEPGNTAHLEEEVQVVIRRPSVTELPLRVDNKWSVLLERDTEKVNMQQEDNGLLLLTNGEDYDNDDLAAQRKKFYQSPPRGSLDCSSETEMRCNSPLRLNEPGPIANEDTIMECNTTEKSMEHPEPNNSEGDYDSASNPRMVNDTFDHCSPGNSNVPYGEDKHSEGKV
ncbi:hypothetical protein MLD38_004988 [Melastoma candidum]|uniref:Uncharacterized protein n=1 Tax=Melastoma candidum TaxID=119954 RepID=A0ACB9S6Z1_9MYRT|nr:hypothetical protein MLD38_004988 [Melastoma candidum]